MRTLNRKSENNRQSIIDPVISLQKKNKIEIDLQELKDIIRPKLAQEVSRLAELGDFSENVEYQLAKGKLRRVNDKITILENKLKQAQVVDIPKNNSTIQIGHTVTIESNSQQITYQILGSQESNPSAGIISHSSPIGQALLGKKVGDVIIVKPVNKEIKYKIVGIE